MKLRNGLQAVALKIQEQADELSNSDVCRWLSDALKDMEGYCYYVDHIGDGESGDVIYSCGGDLMKAPYEIRSVNGKVTATIDDEEAVDVLPRTTYEPEADEEDHYASMEAAKLYTEGGARIVERFISKGERDQADSGSFAGKGKSFPILKPGDVMAAVRSMGRAGSDNYGPAALKKNIIAIAKRKGWTKYLPKSWQSGGGGGSDSSEAGGVADLDLVGDCIPLREGAVGQDGSALLKLIAPGWGSCGYYPAEVLERDGPKVFPKGTKNFWNHQTDAEEAARPEGDLRDLASVLTEDAHFDKKGPDGPGLYARAKVFENFRQPVDDLARHIGMSIRASGTAKEGEIGGKKGRIIEQLKHGVSVDYVTTPGAGGKILQLFEAARGRQSQTENEGDDMDMKEALALLKKQSERLALREAKDYAADKIGSERLNEATKKRLLERVVQLAPLSEAGELDTKKFDEIIAREVKEEAEYLAQVTGHRIVTNMGDGTGIREGEKLGKKERKKLREVEESFEEGMKEVGRTLGLSKEGRKLFVAGRGEVA